MKIALVRHGHAHQHAVDALRPLSDIGKTQATEAGEYLKLQDFKPTKVFHSELVRAKETAFLISSLFPHPCSLEVSPDLMPHSPPQKWADNLMAFDEDILLVGHMPYMALFVEELTGRSSGFPTGGCTLLERTSEGNWKIFSQNYDA